MADITEIQPGTYTYDDYAQGDVPYLEILTLYSDNEFDEAQAVNRANDCARMVGFKQFKSTYRKFKVMKAAADREKAKAQADANQERKTAFSGQPGAISCGSWVADDNGVRGIHPITHQPVVACPYPIMPYRRLVNVDTGIIKIDIRFKLPNGKWQSLIVDRSIIASSNRIVQLADRGIGVTSETAKDLVRYFLDCESHSTENEIKEVHSVSRMGYISDYGFSPYQNEIVFDGDINYKKIFDSVKEKGSFETWKEHIKKVRKNLAARLVIDAAFASVILNQLNVLPFCVHLWGVDSGTGKTVALMCAASVWADPSEGKYIQTWNSTQVGRERYAALLNNLPMIFDELQLDKAKGSQNSGSKLYELTQGIGRTRGSRSGIDATSSWCSCIISSGETPITSQNQGAGALNRALEIECSQEEKIIEDGHGTAEIIKHNFGHAGHEWITALEQPEVIDGIRSMYEAFFKTAIDQKVTDKQAMAGSVLYAVDLAVNLYIFHENEMIDDDQMLQFLKRNDDVDINRRAFQFLRGWIAQNFGRLQNGNGVDPGGFEVYGRYYADSVVIIKKIFDRVLLDEGFSPNALVKWMASHDLIVKDRNGNATYNQYVNRVCNCIQVKTSETSEEKMQSEGFSEVEKCR